MDGSVVTTTPLRALSVAARVGRHYRGSVVLGGLWVFGLLSVFLLPAPVAVTPEMQKRHDAKTSIAAEHEVESSLVYTEYLRARYHTNAARVWFWRFKPDARKEVAVRRAVEQEVYKRYRVIEAQHRAAVSDARAEMGVWTSLGIDASRSLFWDSYESGKLIARRQTLWDVAGLLFQRDTDGIRRLVEFLCILAVNFVTGMICALFIFLAQLPSLILSFKPTLISGGLFFFTALWGGISVIFTLIALLVLSTFTIGFITVTTFQQPQSQQQRLRHRPRAHLE